MERIDGFMPFKRALAWSEMQTASSRIWTLITDSISYIDQLFWGSAWDRLTTPQNNMFDAQEVGWQLLPKVYLENQKALNFRLAKHFWKNCKPSKGDVIV